MIIATHLTKICGELSFLLTPVSANISTNGMKFTDEQLDKFIILFKQEFGKTIDRAEAQRQAVALITLVKRIYRPMTEEVFGQVVAKMIES